MKIILDESVPQKLRLLIEGNHEVPSGRKAGLSEARWAVAVSREGSFSRPPKCTQAPREKRDNRNRMKFRAWISRGLLVATLWPASGSHGQTAANLQLRLQDDAAPPTGSPGFSLLLANDTDHDVYIPVPGVNCEDDYSGWVQLHLDFRPLSGRRKSEVGEGCASDRMGPLPPILDRLSEKGQEWQLVHPGDALSLIAGTLHSVVSTRVSWEIVKAGQSPSRRGMPAFQDDGDPGVYQLWAIYHPPLVGVWDLRTLQEGRIDIPRSRPKSNRLTFVKQR